jgi:hypothetical protein
MELNLIDNYKLQVIVICLLKILQIPNNKLTGLIEQLLPFQMKDLVLQAGLLLLLAHYKDSML